MEGLTPGEKIKKLRLDLGLKQDDLTNEEVSKCLISMIERNKRGLTWSVAKIVADSFNQYYKSMNKEITPEYLMETEIERITKEVKGELEYIQSLLDTGKIDAKLMTPIFDKLLGLVNEWGLRIEKAELLFLRGKFNYLTYQYNNAIKDFSEVLAYYIEYKNYSQVARTYNFLGMSNQMLMSIEQAITNYTLAYNTTLHHDIANGEKIRMQSSINIIMCYRKIKRYDIALQHISMFKETKWKDQNLLQIYNADILLLEANTFRDMTNFERAEQVYGKLLEIKVELDDEMLFLAYENYASCLLNTKKIDRAVKYIDKALELKEKVKVYKFSTLWIYLTKSKAYMKTGRISKVFNVLNEGLALAEEYNNIELIIEFHFTLIQTYVFLENYEKALSHLKIVEKYILQNKIKTKENDLNIFFAEIYCKTGETEKGVEYMLKVRKDYFALNNE